MFSTMVDDGRYLVIFDGVCNFCNSSVNFIIKRDPQAQFAFAPLQGEYAQTLISQYGLEDISNDTFLLIKHGKCYTRTDAALEITKDLSGLWYLCNGFRVIPKPIRDFFYRVFARNRYRLFGRKEVCMVPDTDVRKRFLGLE